jgi:hypothetical protein
MKYVVSLVFCLSIFSCAKDSDTFIESENNQYQNRETDFNFVLRAIHPNQIVEFKFPDGSTERRTFQGNMLVFNNGKVNGHAHVNTELFEWRYKAIEANYSCVEGFMIVHIVTEVLKREHRIPHRLTHRDRAIIVIYIIQIIPNVLFGI